MLELNPSCQYPSLVFWKDQDLFHIVKVFISPIPIAILNKYFYIANVEHYCTVYSTRYRIYLYFNGASYIFRGPSNRKLNLQYIAYSSCGVAITFIYNDWPVLASNAA